VKRVASQGRKERKVFMKKVLLIVSMLLVVSPVMATVTVTAVQEGNAFTGVDANVSDAAATVRITYSGTAADPNIRAFALDINVDSGCTIERIRDFNVGENSATVQGYGIFPGRFAQYINPTSPVWSTSGYNPTVASGEPGASGTGLNTNTIIAEMGYLGAPNIVGGVDTNMPAKSGTLFRVDVNGYAFVGTAHLTISADATRGGVVSKDSNATLTSGTNLPVTVPIVFQQQCITPANEIGQPVATAIAAWTAQGFTNLNQVNDVCCAYLGEVWTHDQNCVIPSTQVNYHVGIAPTEPNVIGMTRAAAVTALNTAGFSVGASSTDINSYGGPNNVTAVGYVFRTNPVPGTQACSQTVVLSVVSYPIKATSSIYANWVTEGKPQCWGYPRQCHGDADGKAQLGLWVGSNDLAILKSAYNKALTQIPPGGTCADFDHKAQLGLYVGSNDLAILKKYYNAAASNVPICGDTSTTSDPNFWYWCNPTGGTCPTSPAGQVCAPAGTCPNSP